MSPSPDVATEWTPATEFDDYRLVRRLGHGAMGQVWLAHDRVLDRQVAIKFLLSEKLDAESRERFFAEARSLAKLQHPNVVAIHRVGETSGQPYLVSEFLEGQTLDALPRPMPWRRALELGFGLSSGLAAAHRAGLLHRDIKPANAMVTTDGLVKLLDFGIAKLGGDDAPATPAPVAVTPATSATPARPLTSDETAPSAAIPVWSSRIEDAGHAVRTQAGVLVGTPLYLAPELWKGEAATPRSDVFSLGTVLFQLVTGRAPFEGLSPIELARQQTSTQAPTVRDAAPGIDAGFAAIIERCLHRSPDARFPSAVELRVELERLTTSPVATLDPDVSPFRGWLPFEAAHRATFLGRSAELTELHARLAQGFVTVVGDSASGKTSLCLAGALPRIEGTVVSLRAESPWQQLVEALGVELQRPAAELASTLRERPGDVARALAGKKFTVFIDPLEALLGTAGEEHVARALAALLEAQAITMLATARPDALEALSRLPALGDKLGRSLFWLRAPNAASAKEMVTGAARLAGFAFESNETVDELMAAAAEPGGLALMQHTLAELWARRDRTRKLFTRAAWDELDGVGGALVRHAEEVLAGLDAESRSRATSLLSSLVSPEGRRQSLRVSQLVGEEAWSRRALDVLVRERLVVVRREGVEPMAALISDALIERWAALRELADREREHKRLRARLERARTEWDRLNRVDDALLSVTQLAEYEASASLGSDNDDFLERSRRYRQRQRRARFVLGIGVPLVLLGAAAVPLKARYDAQTQRDVHVGWAVRTRDEASRAVERALVARRDALALFDQGKRDEAEAAWVLALQERTTADNALELATRTATIAREFGDDVDARARVTSSWQARERFARQTGRRALARTLRQEGQLPEPPSVEVRVTSEPAARVTWDVGGAEVHDAGVTPTTLSLPASSVTLTLEAEGRARVLVPLLLDPDEPREVTVALPLATQVPPGFTWIPPGDFLFGAGGDEGLRTYFLNAEPMHRVTTPGYLIAVHETTFAEWIDFLSSLPREERARRRPDVSWMVHGVSLLDTPKGFRLRLTTAEHVHEVAWGEPLRFDARPERTSLDWGQLPVSGISFQDAEAYFAWLRSTGRVPNARACTDVEWERAARGADGRTWPHGEKLEPEDANFDLTWGRSPERFGPDTVGSHPRSRSPFGLFDTSGNVWEWTVDAHDPTQVTNRGGSWYQGRVTAQLANRELSEPAHRDPLLGLRVCADLVTSK